MVAWGNYMYTIQGAYDYFLGEEGVSYTVDEDGHTQLTDLVLHNPDGLSSEQALLRYSFYSGGANPGLCTDDTFKGGETYWTSLDGNKKFDPYLIDTVWEVFPLSDEGTEIINNTLADISAVVGEYTAKFVSGKLDIDENWEEYKSQLKHNAFSPHCQLIFAMKLIGVRFVFEKVESSASSSSYVISVLHFNHLHCVDFFQTNLTRACMGILDMRCCMQYN